jgi:hypothetical protein
MVLALLLTAIALADTTPAWARRMLAFGLGAPLAFNLPARYALIPILVLREDVHNAIALSSVTLNAVKVLGPALAGIPIAHFRLAL